jgi:type I restriction-modification system DNA methylase subunit
MTTSIRKEQEDVGAFLQRVITEYAALYEEIESKNQREHDLAERLTRHLFINALGFDPQNIEREADWNDIRVYDDEEHPQIIVETKNRETSVTEGLDQAFRYASEQSHVKFWAVSNIDRFLLFRGSDEAAADEVRKGKSGKLVADINFEGIVNKFSGDSLSNDLSLQERQELQQLTALREEEITNEDRFDDFSIPDRQDVSTDSGFKDLIRTLSHCLDTYFMPYALSAFDEFQNRYDEFRSQADDLEQQISRLREEGHEDSEIAELEVELNNLRDEYSQYRKFQSDFETWINLSQRQGNDETENKRVFCRESIYVQINKILLIRIAEDQDLTTRMISNSGVSTYFDFWENYSRYTTHDYNDLFDFASQELSEIYEHLYTQRIFDWPLQNGDELNEVLQKTMWHLNHFDFSEVNRDVLGHLYEEHLDPEERKELGEFYTPTSIVDFILDQVGYTADEPIELPENDILDPACGSGTFLVRATKRLRERLENKGVGAKESLRIIQERINGFDINPFATHICEMNLLFQVVDLYREVKDQNEEFTLDRFEIYQTDSLRSETQSSLTSLHSNALQRKYHEEKQEAYRKKQRDDYGYVVGNPPYVRVQNLPQGPARDDYDDYYTAYYNYDLYCLFVERAANWLRSDGSLGYILSNKFVQSRYGERLREFIPMNYQPKTVVDFGSVDVFRSAKAFPLVFTAKRINKDQRDRNPEEFILNDEYRFNFVNINTEKFPELLEANAIRGWDEVDDNGVAIEAGVAETPTIPDLLNAVVPSNPGDTSPNTLDVLANLGIDTDLFDAGVPLEVYPVSSEMISGSEWRFVSAQEEGAIKALESGGVPLETYCEQNRVERGLRTGANDVFVINEATIEQEDLEEEIIHPLVGGQQVERWYAPWEDRYVIYTRNNTDLDDYPNIKSYLADHRDTLEDRWCVSEGGEPWYAIDKTKSPEMFERKKIVTADILLYNNFWLDESEKFYCLDTTYYILGKEGVSEWYLLGVLNSDAVQFFYRRMAPTYKDEFLRYKSGYLKEIPIPDPNECDEKIVSRVESIGSTLQDRVAEYRRAEDIKEDPELVASQENIDRESTALAGYINKIELSEGEINDLYTDGKTLKLNVQDSITFTSESVAKAFKRLLEIMQFETVDEIGDGSFPRTEEDLEMFIHTYDNAAESIDKIEQEIKDLESELNDLIYQLYELDDGTREYIAETVKTPTTPVRPKAMSDEEP